MDSLHVLVCMRTCNSTNVFVLSAGERIEANVSSARHKQNTWQNLMQHQVCTPDRRHQVRKTWTGPVAGMDGVRGPDRSPRRRSDRREVSQVREVSVAQWQAQHLLLAQDLWQASVAATGPHSRSPQRLELLEHSSSRSSKCSRSSSKPGAPFVLESMLSLRSTILCSEMLL